jgi:Lrp/AsnC family transcriptional regulator, leucine-responsive regulatory protein
MASNRKQNGQYDEDGTLDETNCRLLAELQSNARMSLAELGRRVGLSSPAVAERLHRLEQERVILGYHAELNPRALGFTLSAVVRVRPALGQLSRVADLAQTTPEVVECRRITGEDCYIMHAHVRGVEHLEEIIDRFALYGQTTTSIVQSSPVPTRGLDLSGHDPLPL